jgi:hypothetical protein
MQLDIQKAGVDTQLDPIQLSIFSHRFMSIAEQVQELFIFHFFFYM